MTTPPLLSTHQLTHGPIQNLTHQWPAGVSWVCGDEGCGKTTLLRLLAGDLQPTSGTVSMPAGGVFWANLQDAVHDQTSVNVCWTTLRQRYPNWQDDLQYDLADAADRQQLAQCIDSELSPENLTCDGEIRGAALQKKYRTLITVAQELKAFDPTVTFQEI